MFGTAFAYIALAFFMARISLAAATAAGEACCLAAGCCAGACWAWAGTPLSANPTTRPTAKTFATLFIPILLIAALWPFNNANSLRTSQHRQTGKTNEQPVLDDTGDRGQEVGQPRSIRYSSEVGIDDPVAAIGDENVAMLAVSNHHLPGKAGLRKHFADGPPCRRPAKRNHLYRKRKATESLHPFGLICDHYHAIRRRGDDLLAQQRAAATLDQVERSVEFVRAIDREVQPVDLLQRGQRNAAPCRIRAGCFRCRHADHFQSRANPFAQELNEMLRRRAGAETELHAVLHLLERARCGLPLQSVHVHVHARPRSLSDRRYGLSARHI